MDINFNLCSAIQDIFLAVQSLPYYSMHW